MTKLKIQLLRLALLLVVAAPLIAAATESPDPYAGETPAQRDARLGWFRAARFGMFIHWGVYSVPAGTYEGKQIPGIGEWIMNRGKIPMTNYQAFAREYNPVKYDADAWVKLARDAGMKYIVITAKHHDGFANFATKRNTNSRGTNSMSWTGLMKVSFIQQCATHSSCRCKSSWKPSYADSVRIFSASVMFQSVSRI